MTSEVGGSYGNINNQVQVKEFIKIYYIQYKSNDYATTTAEKWYFQSLNTIKAAFQEILTKS